MDTFDRIPNREDYLSAPPSHAPRSQAQVRKPATQSGIHAEERTGSLIAAGGIIWGVYLLTHSFTGTINYDVLTPGPLGAAAVGILIWLHAKWRRSVNRT